eukprot:5141797-Prymnesium_polylepis.1
MSTLRSALLLLALLSADALAIMGVWPVAGPVRLGGRARTVRCLQGTSRASRVDDDDEPISDDEVENMFFLFDDKGTVKPWAVKPHVQGMLQELERGAAILLDVRPAAAWKAGHLAIATS